MFPHRTLPSAPAWTCTPGRGAGQPIQPSSRPCRHEPPPWRPGPPTVQRENQLQLESSGIASGWSEPTVEAASASGSKRSRREPWLPAEDRGPSITDSRPSRPSPADSDTPERNDQAPGRAPMIHRTHARITPQPSTTAIGTPPPAAATPAEQRSPREPSRPERARVLIPSRKWQPCAEISALPAAPTESSAPTSGSPRHAHSRAATSERPSAGFLAGRERAVVIVEIVTRIAVPEAVPEAGGRPSRAVAPASAHATPTAVEQRCLSWQVLPPIPDGQIPTTRSERQAPQLRVGSTATIRSPRCSEGLPDRLRVLASEQVATRSAPATSEEYPTAMAILSRFLHP